MRNHSVKCKQFRLHEELVFNVDFYDPIDMIIGHRGNNDSQQRPLCLFIVLYPNSASVLLSHV